MVYTTQVCSSIFFVVVSITRSTHVMYIRARVEHERHKAICIWSAYGP